MKKNSFRMVLRLFLILIISISFLNSSADACSTFSIKTEKELVYGRNFDFFTGMAYVMTNHRGLAKFALIDPTEQPARWVSKYGSITFNQFGKEFPYGGMNEKGLVVAQMACEQGQQLPEVDKRTAISVLQWIQYQLDISVTVQDVIDSDKVIRISKSGAPLHYLVTDRNGDSVVIEHINGKMVYYRGATLPVSALTNTPYKDSLEYGKKYMESGNVKDIWDKQGSYERFSRIAVIAGNYPKNQEIPIVKQAFDILANVAQGEHTMWSAVYEPRKLLIHFHSKENKKIRTINLNDFDFSCSSVPLAIYIDENDYSLKNWKPFSLELNRELIQRLVKECEFAKNILTGIEDIWIKYPGWIKCKETKQAQ